MKRYIKINSNNEITDLFFEVWKDRFDGTEIFHDEVEGMDVYINGKCISDDIGNPLFKYEKGKIIETTAHAAKLEAYKTEQENAIVKAELYEIDQKSIRAIREYIAAQKDAPEYLKQYEAEATEKRAKLK